MEHNRESASCESRQEAAILWDNLNPIHMRPVRTQSARATKQESTIAQGVHTAKAITTIRRGATPHHHQTSYT